MKRGGRLKPVRDWKTKTADIQFSLYIRRRDKHCQYPGCAATQTDNSHFFERHHSGTRYDPDNCIALCRAHHTEWEKRKKWEYKEFMIARLGIEQYYAMEKRAWSFKKREVAVAECVAFLAEEVLE